MNWDRAKGHWKQVKGRVRQQLAKWTDDPVEQLAGSREVLAGRLQEAYGVGKEEAERQTNSWQKSVGSIDSDKDISPQRVSARR
jgi:uncharacterized protein YjbJ (UPF0337 family)